MSTVVFWILWFALMSAIVRWIARDQRLSKRARPGVHVQPRSLLVIATVSALMFGGIGASFVLYPEPHAPGLPVAICLFFLLLSAYMLLDYFRVRVAITDYGLSFRPTLRPQGTLTWSEVTSVTYSQGLKWFRLRSPTSLVRIPVTLTGLPELAGAILHNVAPTAIAESALAPLQDSARGNPPSIWQ